MNMKDILDLILKIVAVSGFIIAVIVAIHKIFEGQRCLLRAEMLRIYYHNLDKKVIRQYEFENFVLMYEAYKKLRGNSFIDKIYKEVQTWKVIT